MLDGWHSCTKEWRVYEGEDSYLSIADLTSIIQSREPTLIQHNKIGWKNMDNPSDKIDERYYEADIMYPGIVAIDVINPYNKPYRMVDGSHRMAKMKLETEFNASFFYVITPHEFYTLLRGQYE